MSEKETIHIVKNPPFQSHFNQYGKQMEFFKNRPPKVAILDENFIRSNFSKQFHQAILSADVRDSMNYLQPSQIYDSYQGPQGDHIRSLQAQFWDKSKIVKLTEEEEEILREDMGPQFVLNTLSMKELKAKAMSLVAEKHRLANLYSDEMDTDRDLHKGNEEEEFVSRKILQGENQNQTLYSNEEKEEQNCMEL